MVERVRGTNSNPTKGVDMCECLENADGRWMFLCMRSCYIVHGESINVSLLYLASDRDSPIYSGNNDNVIEQTIDVRPLPPSLF